MGEWTVASPNHESRGGTEVIWLVVHTKEGQPSTLAELAHFLSKASSQVSYHDVVDDENTIHCVDYSQASWSAFGANHPGDHVCCIGYAAWSRAVWLGHPGMLENIARWLASRSRARGIPLVHIGAAGVSARKRGVIGHVDYTIGAHDGSHTDPGPNFPWDVVISRARELTGDEPDPEVARRRRRRQFLVNG